MFIKPAPGLVVRDPVSRLPLPESGREVPDTDTYWYRRIADGDVVISEPPSAPAAGAPAVQV